MIVEYESIKDHIMRVIEASDAGGRRIKYIVLDKAEYDELLGDDEHAPPYKPDGMFGSYCGITIVGFKYHTNKRKEGYNGKSSI